MTEHLTGLKLSHSPLPNLGHNEDWKALAITNVSVPRSCLPPAPQKLLGVPMQLPLLRADPADRGNALENNCLYVGKC